MTHTAAVGNYNMRYIFDSRCYDIITTYECLGSVLWVGNRGPGDRRQGCHLGTLELVHAVTAQRIDTHFGLAFAIHV